MSNTTIAKPLTFFIVLTTTAHVVVVVSLGCTKRTEFIREFSINHGRLSNTQHKCAAFPKNSSEPECEQVRSLSLN